MQKKNTLITLVLIAAAFLLGILVASNNKSDTLDIIEVKDEQSNEEVFDITDIGASDGGDAGILETGDYTIRQANNIYNFDSVSFHFTDVTGIFMADFGDDQPVSTQVRMQIENFRRNGQSIELGSFRLGVYSGQCEEVEYIENDLSLGQSLGFVRCWWAGQGAEIAVFQEAKFINVFSRFIDEQGVPTQFDQILSIDLSQLIE